MARYSLLCGLSLCTMIVLVTIIKLQKETIDRFYFPHFRPRKQEVPVSTVLKEEKEWMSLSQHANYSDYGDNTCADNPHRSKYERLMKRWLQIAKEFNVTYFITFGSLLGAWRNQDVVPYDMDMDVSVPWEETIKFVNIREAKPFSPWDEDINLYLHKDWTVPTEKRRSFNCQGVEVHTDHCSFREPVARLITQGVYLDIFNYKTENNKLVDVYTELFRNDIFPLTKCLFMKFETVCPKKPQVIFKGYYDEDISIPSKICKNGEWVGR